MLLIGLLVQITSHEICQAFSHWGRAEHIRWSGRRRSGLSGKNFQDEWRDSPQRNQRPEHSFCVIILGLKGHFTQIITKTCSKPKILNFLLMPLVCFLPFTELIWSAAETKSWSLLYNACGLNILADKRKQWLEKTGWLSSHVLQQIGWSDPLRAPLWSNRSN